MYGLLPRCHQTRHQDLATLVKIVLRMSVVERAASFERVVWGRVHLRRVSRGAGCPSPVVVLVAGRRARGSPPMPPDATPGSRDSSSRSQDARRAISNSFRGGHFGGPRLRGVSRIIRRFSQAVILRVKQCFIALCDWAQYRSAGTRGQHFKVLVLQPGALSEGGPCGEPHLRAVSRGAGQRSTAAELVVE